MKNKKYEKIYAKNQPKVPTVTTTHKNPRTKTKQNKTRSRPRIKQTPYSRKPITLFPTGPDPTLSTAGSSNNSESDNHTDYHQAYRCQYSVDPSPPSGVLIYFDFFGCEDSRTLDIGSEFKLLLIRLWLLCNLSVRRKGKDGGDNPTKGKDESQAEEYELTIDALKAG